MNPLLHTLASLTTLTTQPLAHALGWTLLHFLWQGLLVAAVLWCLLGLLPAQLSRTRYAVALLALGLMAALPLVTFARLAAADLAASRALALAPISIDSSIVIGVTPGDTPEPLLPRLQRALDNSVPWLPALWLAGVILFLARLNFGLLLARRMASAAALTPPQELQRIFDQLRARLGIDRAVRLLHSAVVQVPTVIGWLRPVVLVPVGCLAAMSPTQVEAILAHELAHIRRHDYLVSVLQSVVEALLFYQPAVWWVSRQVRRERENCCDDVAVRLAGDPLAYARALSSLEEHRASMPAIALAANGGALKLRIRRLLGYPDDRVALQPVAITLLVVATLAAATYALAAAHAQPTSQPSTTTAADPTSNPGAPSYPALWDRVGYRAKLDLPSLTSPTPQAQTAASDDASAALPPPYNTWLNQDVLWIVTPEERAAFLKLATDGDRDQFIAQFWASRNPPSAAPNTFRAEHYARIAYANQHYASDSQPGWKTAFGHVYIVYGEPNMIMLEPGVMDASGRVDPSEVWHYNSLPGIGDNVNVKFVDTCMCGDPHYTIDRPEQSGSGPAAINQTKQAARLSLDAKLLSSPQTALAIADGLYKRPDPASLAQAAQEYREFLATYPNAPEAMEVRKRLAAIVDTLTSDLPKRPSTVPNAAPGSVYSLYSRSVTIAKLPDNLEQGIDLRYADIQKRLTSAQAAAKTAIATINSPEFQKHLADARVAAVRLGTIDLQKQLAEAAAASESAQRLTAALNSPGFKQQMAHAEAAVDAVAARIDTPEFRQRLDETTKAATELDLEFKSLAHAQAANAQAANAVAASAPQATGSIAGKISGPSGAVVPHATVTAIDTDTGTRTFRETDDSGDYSISPLPPGPYLVEIVAQGFLRLLQENVSVKPQQQARVDLKLSTGPAGRTATSTVPEPNKMAVLRIDTPEEAAGVRRFTAPPSAAPPSAAPPSADPPSRVPIASLDGSLISKVDPVYPPIAKAAHVQGAVILHALISKTGTIEKLEIVSGPSMLATSAMDAVAQWKYKPYIVSGQPVEVSTNITVNFTFADEPAAASPPSSTPTLVVNSTAESQSEETAQTQPETGDLIKDLRKVGGPVSLPVLLYSVGPKFSQDARKAKVSGTVLISLIVDQNGLPQNVHVVRGVEIGRDGRPNPDLTDEARAAAATLDKNAVDAVKQYKFKPAAEDGKPVPVLLNVEVNFKLF